MKNQIAHQEIDYDSVGEDAQHAAPAPAALAHSLDDALGLQPISIRLQKDLIDSLKSLGQLNGLGYQPLIRQILTRWVDCELKSMLNARMASERAKQAEINAQAELPENAMRAAA